MIDDDVAWDAERIRVRLIDVSLGADVAGTANSQREAWHESEALGLGISLLDVDDTGRYHWDVAGPPCQWH